MLAQLREGVPHDHHRAQQRQCTQTAAQRPAGARAWRRSADQPTPATMTTTTAAASCDKMPSRADWCSTTRRRGIATADAGEISPPPCSPQTARPSQPNQPQSAVSMRDNCRQSASLKMRLHLSMVLPTFLRDNAIIFVLYADWIDLRIDERGLSGPYARANAE